MVISYCVSKVWIFHWYLVKQQILTNPNSVTDKQEAAFGETPLLILLITYYYLQIKFVPLLETSQDFILGIKRKGKREDSERKKNRNKFATFSSPEPLCLICKWPRNEGLWGLTVFSLKIDWRRRRQGVKEAFLLDLFVGWNSGMEHLHNFPSQAFRLWATLDYHPLLGKRAGTKRSEQ